MMHDWGIGSGWEELLFNPYFTALLFVFWITLIVAFIASLGESSEHAGTHMRAARDILDEHLARGDIDREEYVDRRRALDHITAIV
jgi:putative membrane protein